MTGVNRFSRSSRPFPPLSPHLSLNNVYMQVFACFCKHLFAYLLAYMEINSYLCSVIKKEIVKQLKLTTMKTTKITKHEAIEIIKNILNEGCAIPQASLGNGGAGFGYVQPDAGYNEYDELVSWLKGMKSFRIVPSSEISDEFSDIDLNEYDVCVEFTNNDGDYSEQYLLWDIESFKD